MESITFELASREHAKAIEQMRNAAGIDLLVKLGEGSGRPARAASIRERIACADPVNLRRRTLYVACKGGNAVASLSVTTWPPNFWKKHYWREPLAKGLGVVGIVVFPEMQRTGIGRFLMGGVEELARSHGIPFVRLDAFAANPFSNAFYRSIGYDLRTEINLRGVGLNLYEKDVRSAPIEVVSLVDSAQG